jgi:serine phosphatase RsbU (regulator of sigma subunit)/ligand-binding sensor domain-containing protein
MNPQINLYEKKVWGEVHGIAQLKNGLILAADATVGLKAYNTATDKFDPYFLKPNYNPQTIYNIYEGSDGSIWFAGFRLIKYSPAQYSVKEIDFDEHSKIKTGYKDQRGIVEDSQGNLWVGVYTRGLFKIDKQLKQFDQYLNNPGDRHSLPDDKITKLFQDKYGNIWIAFIDGGIAQMDPNSNPFELYEINLPKKNNNQTIIGSIAPSPVNESELILGTNSDGILKYDLKLNRVTYLDIKDASIRKDSNNFVNELAVDHQGNVWYSINNSQLKKYNITTKKIEIIESPHNNKTAQPFSIRSIDVSPDSKIWISSNYGVDRYDPLTKEFFSIPRIMNKKMSSDLRYTIDQIRSTRNPINSILEVGEGQNIERQLTLDKNSNIIVISVGEGRAIGGMFDRGRISDSKGGTIWEMSDIYKTFNNGGGFKNRIGLRLLNLQKGNYQLSYYSDIGHSYKDWNTLSPDDSLFWGIEAYEVNDAEAKSLNELIEQDIENKNSLPFEIGMLVAFSKTNPNTVWIGSSTNSFFRYDLTSNLYTQYNFDKNNLTNASHYIYCFHEDLEGILWVGTYSSLVRLNPKSGELHSFSTLDGLPGGNIYSITEDNNGALWIYSSGGLSKLIKNAPVDKYSFVNYDAQDGLEGLAQSTTVLKNEKGRIFFGGRGGIISFVPGSINTIEPDIVVYDFKIDDISIFDDSSSISLDEGIYDIEKIELSFNQNDIAFEFSSIHLSRPGKNKISYQLQGFSNKWYESDRNFASFTNLDPGEYKFKVKGSNGDGIWNEEGRSISILINPPWWQTTFAYISYGLLFVLVVFGIDRFQRRRLLAKARERARIKESEMRVQLAEAENERKTKELEEARELQLSMLPKDLPNLPNLDIAVYMQTATEVGGDYYDFHVGMDGTLTVVVGDATGHGMKAGTMVTTTKSLFNILAPNPDILTTFSEISRVIKGMQFHQLSMCLMLLKIKGDQLFVSSAAMPPALIYRKKNKAIEEIFMKGMPLGSINNFPYTVKESHLEKGDTIILLSDGLPELTNDSNEIYGYDRTKTEFHSVGEKEPEEIVDHLKNSGSQWLNGKEPDDDVTFVVIKVK